MSRGESRQAGGGRISRLFAGSRALVRIVYRDPENVPERLALKALERMGEPAREWAARVAGEDPSRTADDLRRRTAQVARIDGAIAGTPFFIALVPGYMSFLWQEAVMVLRIAALYGSDPGDLQTAADLLALRGVHPSPELALAALRRVASSSLPEKPPSRRPLRTWVRSVRMVLVFGGFLDPPGERSAEQSRALAVLGTLAGIAIWAITWVLPLSFMIAMAWSCERNARDLGRRALAFYAGGTHDVAAAIEIARRREDAGHGRRQLVRSAAMFLSLALPIGFVGYADHVRNTTGLNWIAALGALVALSLVIAGAVFARSR